MMAEAKQVVITGVTRGLGQAMVQGMAAAGHRVWGCGRNAEAIATLQKELGDPHDFAVVDVAEDRQVKQWSDRLISQHGAPDLVINNAAVINPPAALWEVPAEEFSQLIDVNIKGVVNVIRHFVPAMLPQQSGVIVNLSSGWGRSTSPNVAPYCASKWAIEGLTQALAQELPKGMAAIALNPGIIHTEMLEICFGDSASLYDSIADWQQRAVPYLLQLGPRDNGRACTVPG